MLKGIKSVCRLCHAVADSDSVVIPAAFYLKFLHNDDYDFMNAPERSSMLCAGCLGNFTNLAPRVKVSRRFVEKLANLNDLEDVDFYDEITSYSVKRESIKREPEDTLKFEIPNWDLPPDEPEQSTSAENIYESFRKIKDEPISSDEELLEVQPDLPLIFSPPAPKCVKERKQHNQRKKRSYKSDVPWSEKYVCKLCGGSPFTKRKYYLIHLRKHEKGEFMPKRKSWKTREIPKANHYTCKLCGQEFEGYQRNYYLNHIKKHTTSPPQCDYCGIHIRKRHQILPHMVKVHKKQLPFEVQCDQCGLEFYNKDQLRIHHNKVHAYLEGAFKCAECDFTAPDVNRLHYHKHKVHRRNRFCEFCGQWFSSRDIFQHKKRHEQMAEKNESLTLKCPQGGCELLFATPAGIRIHLRKVHDITTGDYKCEQCNRCYSSQQKLNNHFKLIHFTVSNIPCPVEGCHYKSKSKDYLRIHLKSKKHSNIDECKRKEMLAEIKEPTLSGRTRRPKKQEENLQEIDDYMPPAQPFVTTWTF